MRQAVEQDKGVSGASVMENVKCAGANVQENLEKAGATITAQVDKVKAGRSEEDRMSADLTKDTRQADAADRADAKKAQYHKEAAGAGGQGEHPAPYTKTPFV